MAAHEQKKQQQGEELWFLKAKCPVFLPQLAALGLSAEQFEAYLVEILNPALDAAQTESNETIVNNVDDFTLVSDETTTTADAREQLNALSMMSPTPETTNVEAGVATTSHPFMDGLKNFQKVPTPPSDEDMENKMLTENGDVAFRSTKDALIDLFSELEEVVSGPRLRELLDAAWKADPLMSLKIIFNARSIHLGKASRLTFYRCAGWLAQYHPRTLVASLAWLSRPVIAKKVDKKNGEDDEMVLVEPEVDENDPSRFDVRNGVAHGYWKDLLNILALSANGKLDVLASPREVLNIEQEKETRKINGKVTQEEAKEKRQVVRDNRHQTVLRLLEEKPVHRALHLAVARLFAEQIKTDLAILRDTDTRTKKNVSLCAKWAPSTAHFHDKHTFVTSSIAEILYPEDHFVAKGIPIASKTDGDRAVYLRHAREAYRKDISALRKHLSVVERDITTKTFDKIKYDRVPSLAMNSYSGLFAAKDTERFEAYIDKVASGKSTISGATLLPSTLIKQLREKGGHGHLVSSSKRGKKRPHALIADRMSKIDDKVIDGQWNTLVQRIKDSGAMESSIAVADVSGSMCGPVLPDGTTPMDTSIGLSLLLAEVSQPPFAGSFITFSERPKVETIDLSASIRDKYRQLQSAEWGMSTNFEAVFTKLILPMAVSNKLTQDQMVKRIFVFSDMQFNSATGRGADMWTSSFERVQKAYKEAGYEVPELIFWNLAGGRAGYTGGYGYGDPIAPKPVTAEQDGVALVSGYSQGMLKVFLDKGVFGDEEEAEEEEPTEKMVDEEDGEGLVSVEKPAAKKKRIDPLSTVKKAISHKAYDMLKVVD